MNSCVCSIITYVTGKQFQIFMHNRTCMFKFQSVFLIPFNIRSPKLLKCRNTRRQSKYANNVLNFLKSL